MLAGSFEMIVLSPSMEIFSKAEYLEANQKEAWRKQRKQKKWREARRRKESLHRAWNQISFVCVALALVSSLLVKEPGSL
jgi:hypothetical protein